MAQWLEAFFLVFVAELGDKSQLLALAFATQYSMGLVLAGVSLGIAFNHGVAIALAVLLSRVIPLEQLRILSAVVFLLFGLKGLSLEEEDEEEEVTQKKRGVLLSIAMTFFFGELGDKTQIVAMTLAAKSSSALLIFTATVSAMILVSLIGILLGKFLGKKIPEVTMGLLASVLFLFFGCKTLLEILPLGLLGSVGLVVLVAGLGAVRFLRSRARVRLARAEALAQALAACNHCATHRADCPRALRIEAASRAYLGEDIPFLGNLVSYLERMNQSSGRKADRLIAKLEEQKIL